MKNDFFQLKTNSRKIIADMWNRSSEEERREISEFADERILCRKIVEEEVGKVERTE